MIRVMIADDHAVMRDGVRHILERAGILKSPAKPPTVHRSCNLCVIINRR